MANIGKGNVGTSGSSSSTGKPAPSKGSVGTISSSGTGNIGTSGKGNLGKGK